MSPFNDATTELSEAKRVGIKAKTTESQCYYHNTDNNTLLSVLCHALEDEEMEVFLTPEMTAIVDCEKTVKGEDLHFAVNGEHCLILYAASSVSSSDTS